MIQPTHNEKRSMPQFIIAASDDQRPDARTMEFPASTRSRPNDADSTTWVCERLTECYNN
ncbi:MAG: hypothetical protein HY868_05310 [Chloroflexi bacterium]|nr:hypothetical protein [Chloroflexota bacterium]